MAYDDLRGWIKALDKAGELKHIHEPVDPILEIAEITDRVSKWGRPGSVGAGAKSAPGGPALLFENVKGYPGSRVLMNQFGSERRMKLALNVDSLDDVAERIEALLQIKSPEGLLGKLKMLPMLAEVGGFFPAPLRPRTRPASRLSCGRISTSWTFPCSSAGRSMADASLPCPASLPATRRAANATWACTACRSTTGKPQACTGNGRRWPRSTCGSGCGRLRGRGCFRRCKRRAGASDGGDGRRTTAARWAAYPQSTLAQSKDRRLEVAVAIGTDPALTFSAIVPAPPEVEEFVIAGFLRQQAVELVKCETVDLEVPANAEIVLEGYVELDELRMEGPFGDHTGFYTMEEEYPVFHITCITHRKEPVYAATIVGKPPMEDAWMGKAVERIFLPLMKLTIPEIVDVNLPVEGVFHNLMIVSIRKSYAGQARKVMHGIWSLGQAMFTKCVIVVDEDCDVQDLGEVTLRVANNIDPERDIQFTLGPVDSLDHASRLPNYGSKMGIDATRKWNAEGFTRPWPQMIAMDAATKARVDEIWKKLGLD